MPHISKRRKAFDKKVDRAKSYAALDAMKLVKETATAKFDEAVDVAVNLGIDAKKGDQTVRGSVVLPSGPARRCASPCSRPATRPRRPRPRAPRSSVWKTLPSR
jgi:ribosomal protein L1